MKTCNDLTALHWLNFEIKDITRRLAVEELPPEVVELYNIRLEKDQAKRDELIALLEALPDAVRPAAIMRARCMTWPDIAVEMGVNPTTIKQRVRRAIEKTMKENL